MYIYLYIYIYIYIYIIYIKACALRRVFTGQLFGLVGHGWQSFRSSNLSVAATFERLREGCKVVAASCKVVLQMRVLQVCGLTVFFLCFLKPFCAFCCLQGRALTVFSPGVGHRILRIWLVLWCCWCNSLPSFCLCVLLVGNLLSRSVFAPQFQNRDNFFIPVLKLDVS